MLIANFKPLLLLLKDHDCSVLQQEEGVEEWEVAGPHPQWEETGLSPQEQVGSYYQLRREKANHINPTKTVIQYIKYTCVSNTTDYNSQVNH